MATAAARDAAVVWASRRRAELSAAARFRDLTTRLSEHGASAPLVELSREAAADELRHADLCARLVEHFGATRAGAVAEPQVARVAPRGLEGRDALLYELVALSCVTETLSTALLGALVSAARDSFAKETMHSILRDEVRHSRLGWAYLAEAHAEGARDVVGVHLGRMLAATLGDELFQTSAPGPIDATLSGYGALERAERVRVTRECFFDVIFPGLERFGIDASYGKRWLTERTP